MRGASDVGLRRLASLTAATLAAASMACGCSKPRTRSPAEKNEQGEDATRSGTPARTGGKEKIMSITLRSAAFDNGKPMPKKHAYKGEGQNISPALSWSGAPATTKSFAVICDDPDAPSPKNPRPKPWVHWVLYNIPSDRTSLDEGSTGGGTLGKTDFGEQAYGGPMPPPGSGTHRYFFKVYAIDKVLELKAGASKDDLLRTMEGHILGHGETFGTYERR